MSVRRRLAVLATASALAAGMTVGATAGTAQAAGDAGGPAGQTVRVTVRANHTIAMPAEIRPGATRFVVSSPRPAGFQIAQAAPGYTKREAARDINAAFNDNNMRALRRFERNMTLLGGMPSARGKSATMWTRLTRGTYWALDSNPRVLKPAKIRTFTVTGSSVGGRLPGQTIAATGTAKFAATPKRIARKGIIRFVNRSDVPHFISITKLAKGQTMADFREYMETAAQGGQPSGPPPIDFRVSLDSGVISGGEKMSLRYDRLPRGNYVLACFWPMSDMGGMPHAFMGMYRGIRVG
jgi:hypothetical protein